jgi:hypothetical protein
LSVQVSVFLFFFPDTAKPNLVMINSIIPRNTVGYATENVRKLIKACMALKLTKRKMSCRLVRPKITKSHPFIGIHVKIYAMCTASPSISYSCFNP